MFSPPVNYVDTSNFSLPELYDLIGFSLKTFPEISTLFFFPTENMFSTKSDKGRVHYKGKFQKETMNLIILNLSDNCQKYNLKIKLA